MDLDWYPIAPDLMKATGAFASLQNFPRAAELKPVPLRAEKQPLNKWDEWYHGHSSRVTFKLGVGGVFNAGVDAEGHTISYQATWFEDEELDGGPHGGLLHGTRWGAGIRLLIRISTMEASAELDLSSLAAQSQLGRVQATFTVEVFGVKDPSVVKLLPGPGRLDLSVIENFRMAATHIKLLKDGDALYSVPFEVLAPPAFFQTPIYDALSLMFAASRIEKGVSYSDAIADAYGRMAAKVSPLKVHELYQRWGAPLDGSPPSRALRTKAANFLDVY